MNAPIDEILASYPRNKTDGLSEVVTYAQTDHYTLEEIVGYLADDRPNVAARAAWVLRRITEQNPDSVGAFKHDIIEILHQDLIWEVRAELCHIVFRLTMTNVEMDKALQFYTSGLTDTSRVVVAWSLNGLFELSRSNPALTSMVKNELKKALESPYAAVRARARNILKELTKQS